MDVSIKIYKGGVTILKENYLKIATVYFTVAVLIGLTMGIIHDFSLSSVHAHLNLLGWVSMALFGLIYHFYPKAAETKLAIIQFWLHNIGVPIMLGAIALEIITGSVVFIPIAIVASCVIVIGVILFTINTFNNIGSSSSKSERDISE